MVPLGLLLPLLLLMLVLELEFGMKLIGLVLPLFEPLEPLRGELAMLSKSFPPDCEFKEGEEAGVGLTELPPC